MLRRSICNRLFLFPSKSIKDAATVEEFFEMVTLQNLAQVNNLELLAQALLKLCENYHRGLLKHFSDDLEFLQRKREKKRFFIRAPDNIKYHLLVPSLLDTAKTFYIPAINALQGIIKNNTATPDQLKVIRKYSSIFRCVNIGFNSFKLASAIAYKIAEIAPVIRNRKHREYLSKHGK